MSQFVRVRIVSTNGLDLSLFQFDTDQSFAVFLFDPDGTILGRFGTRSHRTIWTEDVSIEGLERALKTALIWHSRPDKYRSGLIAKRGPTPEFVHPKQFPSFKDRYKSTIDYQGKVVPSCIHCHMIGDAVREHAMSRTEKLPEKILFPYPHPKSIGLILDPNTMATIRSVIPGSPAARAGFRPGDEIQKLNGQLILSTADIQWVLHSPSPELAELKAAIIRNNKPMVVDLKLDNGWRGRDDISWRASSWGLRRKATGGMLLEELSEEDRSAQGILPGSMALAVKYVGEYPPHNVAQRAGFQKGDIITAIDSRINLFRETDVIAYSIQNKQPRDQLKVEILRNGSAKSLLLLIPAD